MHVAVFGDQLAEVVAGGLEEAFEDADDILIVQDTKPDGAIAKTAQDWPKIIQDFLDEDKTVAFVVLMFAANERHPFSKQKSPRLRFRSAGRSFTASGLRVFSASSTTGKPVCLGGRTANDGRAVLG